MMGLGQSSLQERATSVALGTLPQLVQTIEVRTNASPPILIDVDELLTGKTDNRLSTRARKALQPTIILRGGSLGMQVIAPEGEAKRDAWKLVYGIAAAVAVVGGGLASAALITAGRRVERRRS